MSEAPERSESDRLVDFLHGAGPNEDGLWFDEAAQREKGAFWWRVYLRRLERIHAAEVERLTAALAASQEAFARRDLAAMNAEAQAALVKRQLAASQAREARLQGDLEIANYTIALNIKARAAIQEGER